MPKNTIGQLVQEASFENSNSAELEIDAPAGVYFVTIRNDKGEQSVVKVVDPDPVQSSFAYSNGEMDAFILKLNTSGKYIW